jgi:hypothetical protein
VSRIRAHPSRREGREVSRELIAAADPAGTWAAALGTAGVFILLTVLVWQLAATWRARMLAAREEEYRQLAGKYAQLLEDNVELHRRNLEELSATRRALNALSPAADPQPREAVRRMDAGADPLPREAADREDAARAD